MSGQKNGIYKLYGAYGCYHQTANNIAYLQSLVDGDNYTRYYIVNGNGNLVARQLVGMWILY